MIQIGDLVQSAISGKIGIVVKQYEFDKNYYYVTYRDSTYSIHTSKLIKLEKQ